MTTSSYQVLHLCSCISDDVEKQRAMLLEGVEVNEAIEEGREEFFERKGLEECDFQAAFLPDAFGNYRVMTWGSVLDEEGRVLFEEFKLMVSGYVEVYDDALAAAHD